MWASLAAHAAPPEGDDDVDIEVVIESERTPDSATSRSLDRDAIQALPARSADDVLRAMPGLHLSAHGGHGKAYQYFLRGFDAVHGADLSIELGGVPVNERSNVHANGYLDLHFIPPVLLSSVDLWPGTWRADAGNYAVAGSAAFHLGLDRPGGLVLVGGGTDRSAEATVAYRPPGSEAGTFVVADATLGQGIGMSRSWRQVRGGAGIQGSLGTVEARAWILAYDGVFDSPGVLRTDDYDRGDVGFYDAYPGSGGGHSTRVLGSAQFLGGNSTVTWQATAYSGWRRLTLQQNFTGTYDDAVHGDGTAQSYDATTAGARGRIGWVLTDAFMLQAGVDTRIDDLSQSERDVQEDGTPSGNPPTTLDGVQVELGAWASAPWTPMRGLRIEPGLRADAFLLSPRDSALSWAPALAPKLSVVIAEHAPVTGFASYGRGYRSPDLRGVGAGGRAPLSVADSAEVGLTADPTAALGFRLAGFATRVSEEIVFDHVRARYLATGTTRRLGVDGGVTVRPIDHLRLQADLTWSDGRYTRSNQPIPYAPRLLANTGVYAERLALGRAELTAGLRLWMLGPRPLPGGFASHAAAVADLTTTLDVQDWQFTAEVDNVLGNRWRDGEFVFASRWDSETTRSELPVRHFTAGTPTAARFTIARRF